MENELPKRKSPIHLPVRLEVNRSAVVFVTVCTDKRKSILARPESHLLLIDAWRRAGAWSVGRYVVMPDHVHMFCAPAGADGPSLTRWVQYWKALVSRAWPRREEQPIWQKFFWDRQLRKGEQYEAKWEYVRQNPIRKGLVAEAEDWPYQGEINLLVWEG